MQESDMGNRFYLSIGSLIWGILIIYGERERERGEEKRRERERNKITMDTVDSFILFLLLPYSASLFKCSCVCCISLVNMFLRIRVIKENSQWEACKVVSPVEEKKRWNRGTEYISSLLFTMKGHMSYLYLHCFTKSESKWHTQCRV